MIRAIDLFAGLGGMTEGARMAGVDVVWAANHWPEAVAQHAANHADVEHSCQDLQQADFRAVPTYDWLLGSPSCVGHTRARGREAMGHDAARATAWAVVTAAEVHRPDVVIVENVPEMRQWVLYPAWRLAMSALGYAMSEHVVDAADVGVPQHRVRLFLVGRRGFAPVRLRISTVPHVHGALVRRLRRRRLDADRSPGPRRCDPTQGRDRPVGARRSLPPAVLFVDAWRSEPRPTDRHPHDGRPLRGDRRRPHAHAVRRRAARGDGVPGVVPTTHAT